MIIHKSYRAKNEDITRKIFKQSEDFVRVGTFSIGPEQNKYQEVT